MFSSIKSVYYSIAKLIIKEPKIERQAKKIFFFEKVLSLKDFKLIIFEQVLKVKF